MFNGQYNGTHIRGLFGVGVDKKYMHKRMMAENASNLELLFESFLVTSAPSFPSDGLGGETIEVTFSDPRQQRDPKH